MVRVGLGLIRVSEFVVGIGGKVYVRVGARDDIRVVSKLEILLRLDHI